MTSTLRTSTRDNCLMRRLRRCWRPAVAALAVTFGLGGPSAPVPAAAQAPELEPYAMVDQWPDKSQGAAGVFQDPRGMDVGLDDRVYVSDAGVGGVHVMLPSGQFLEPFGATGDGPDRLAGPGRLSVDHAGERVYVLDTATERVVAYDLDGAYLTSWGGVAGVAISALDGRVAVADQERNQVVAFGADGAEQFAVGGPGTDDGQFSGLTDVSLGPDGEVLAVGDLGGERVQLFDVAGGRPRHRRTYSLKHPRFSQSEHNERLATYLKCRAGVVHALGEDEVWIGDGTGACQLTPDGFSYAIARSVAENSVCKLSVVLPRVRTATAQYYALATYDPNVGRCRDGATRAGGLILRKRTDLPTTPVVVQFEAPDLKRERVLWLASDDLEQGGLLSPVSLSMPAPGVVFAQDRSPESRFFAPDGSPLATSAMSSMWAGGERVVNERFRVERAEGSDVPGEIIGYYRRERFFRGASGDRPGWHEAEHGIARYRTEVQQRQGVEEEVLEPVWEWPFGQPSQEQLRAIENPRGAVRTVVDLAYDHVSDQVVVLVADRTIGRSDADAHIELRGADGTVVRGGWDLPDLRVASATLNPYRDLDVGPDGRVYVLDEIEDQALAFEADGTPAGTVAMPVDAERVAGGTAGHVFALRAAGYVERIRLADGAVTARFDGRPFSGSDPATLAGLAADGEGRVYVADGQSSVVSVFAPAGPDDGSVPVPGDPGCRFRETKDAEPKAITLGETTSIRLEVDGRCGPGEAPADIVVLTSAYPPLNYSTGETWLGNVTSYDASDYVRALLRTVAQLDLSVHRVGLVSYFQTARVETELTHDPDQVRRGIVSTTKAKCLRESSDPRNPRCEAVGDPSLRAGLGVARSLFEPETGRRQVLVVFQPDYCSRALIQNFTCLDYQPAEDVAAAIRDAGIQIVVFDPAEPPRWHIPAYNDSRTGRKIPVIDHAYPMASSDADVVFGYDDVLARMVEYQVPEVLATDFELVDGLPANMRLVPGSVSAPGSALGAEVTWQLPELSLNGASFTLEVEPGEAGIWPTNTRAVATFTDGWGQPGRIEFRVPEVEVMAPAATPSVPTATEPPAEPTPTVAPTRGPEPTTIHLPLVMRGHCLPATQHVDVALVVDTSESMRGAKLAAAQTALGAFLDTLALGRDRAAVVAFDAQATVVQGLTGDRALLETAVAGLAPSPGTRIDLGLDAATAELTGPGRDPENDGVIVLLSDGRQEEAALATAAAGRAREAGLVVFAIGLGEDADGALLEAIAGDAAHTYFAPTADDLRAVYEQVAGDIPCR